MRRFNTNDLQKPNRLTRNIMERSRFLKGMLKTVGAFGVSLLLAGKYLAHKHLALTDLVRWRSHSSPVNSWGDSRVSEEIAPRIFSFPYDQLTKHSITVINPDISSSTVVGVSCAILIVTFLIQPFGTSKIASAFAPIVIVWLLFNLTFGIYVCPNNSNNF